MRSYAHLSEDERDQIGVLRAAGRSMGAIARALGRAKATISRELQRNALPLGGYSPLHAAGAYQLRAIGLPATFTIRAVDPMARRSRMPGRQGQGRFLGGSVQFGYRITPILLPP
jgi:hypothetical protein